MHATCMNQQNYSNHNQQVEHQSNCKLYTKPLDVYGIIKTSIDEGLCLQTINITKLV